MDSYLFEKEVTQVTKFSDFEFADLNEIELKKIKEVEELINRKMRVNSGSEVYLMAFANKDKLPNESGGEVFDQEPTW